MKFLTLPILLSVFSINAFADGEWKGTVAFEKCHQALKVANESCHVSYHKPDEITRFFKSSKNYDSFEHVTHDCFEMDIHDRPVNVKKYMIKYDSANNTCYYGYSMKSNGTVRSYVNIFKGDNDRSLARIPFDNEKDLLKFIQKPSFDAIKAIEVETPRALQAPKAPSNPSYSSDGIE